jgi:L-ascorbate metabolism protein UlaG (beta-lactamase superfamily)
MRLTWLGHACFEIAGEEKTVLTDPYDASVGYPLHPRRADIVTISHDHFDHNDLSWVQAGTVYRQPGDFEWDGVTVHGIPSFHDELLGRRRGENVIFKITIDGLRVCHLGDLGHRLREDKIRTIGMVDVLLIPVGGCYTIDRAQAAEVAQKLEPRLTVAMHYRTDAVSMAIDDEKGFLRLMGGVKLPEPSLEIDRRRLPARPQFVALDYLR